MSDVSTKPVIFISYSHKDEPDQSPGSETWWLTYVQSHLQPAVKGDIFDLWTDHDIDGGADWRAAIDKKLNDCDIFILLVSRHSVSSDFICGIEVDRMLARRRANEIAIYPIVLSPFATSTVPWLVEMNLMPGEGKPLSKFENADRDTAMVEIVEEIAAKAREIAQTKKTLQASLSVSARLTDLATILPTNASRVVVDIAHLPETPYERLVGRDAQLKCLDEAWADPNTNILSLIAEGGAGKSALVNEWLKGMRADSYRGAETVLGWSFYSQGTKERATSAEQFLNWAVGKLGIRTETASATAKGEAIAEALVNRRVLLVLDGCEPLQHGLDKQQGELKDHGLRALLRRLAAAPPDKRHGLLVLTSRLSVKDIARWKDDSAPVRNIEQLSEEAGAALLRDNGVWGTDKELRAASHDFGNHPLALSLLASFLKEKHFGDVRQRDRIRGLLHDEENPRHDHARRVMESYEKEWLVTEPVELAIMRMVGLFDRPASDDCLRALRQVPAIPAVTEVLINLDEGEWCRAVARLREAKLLSPLDIAAPDALDTHPLVREWFGDRLKQTNETAWKNAHGRLYEHLRDTTREGEAPALEDFAPLYQAIAHGCRAQRHQEALDAVYVDRICRKRRDGRFEFYASKKLGASGSDLAALSFFFDHPYSVPAITLSANAKRFVLGQAGLRIRSQGRLGEALPALRAVVQMAENAADWRNAAATACNLSSTQLIMGMILPAITTAEQSLVFAERCGVEFRIIESRGTKARALHLAGKREEAEGILADLEQRQRLSQSDNSFLYSSLGYYYCDLLIDKRDYDSACERARQTKELVSKENWLLDIARDCLTLGRAHLGLALRNVAMDHLGSDARANCNNAFFSLSDAIDGLRLGGRQTR